MRRKPNGWQNRERIIRSGQQWPESQPAEFVVLAAQKGLTEDEAADDPEIQRWIKQWYLRKYVPEAILVYMGLVITDRQLGFIDFSQPWLQNKHKTRSNTGVTQNDSI